MGSLEQDQLAHFFHKQEVEQRAAGKFEQAQQTQRIAELYRDRGLDWDSLSQLCCWSDRGIATWPILGFQQDDTLVLDLPPFDAAWLLTKDRAFELWWILSSYLEFWPNTPQPEEKKVSPNETD